MERSHQLMCNSNEMAGADRRFFPRITDSGQNPAEPRDNANTGWLSRSAAQEHEKRTDAIHAPPSATSHLYLSAIPPSPYLPRTAPRNSSPLPSSPRKKKEKKETTTATNGSPQDGATLRDVVRKSCLTDTPYHPTLDNSQERPRWQWVWTTTVAVM